MPTLTITVTNQALARIQAAVGDIQGNGPATVEEVSQWIRGVPRQLVQDYERRVALQAALVGLPVPIETTSQSGLEAKSFVEDVEPEPVAVQEQPFQIIEVAIPVKKTFWQKVKGRFSK